MRSARAAVSERDHRESGRRCSASRWVGIRWTLERQGREGVRGAMAATWREAQDMRSRRSMMVPGAAAPVLAAVAAVVAAALLRGSRCLGRHSKRCRPPRCDPGAAGRATLYERGSGMLAGLLASNKAGRVGGAKIRTSVGKVQSAKSQVRPTTAVCKIA
jgi:hypothetical protein